MEERDKFGKYKKRHGFWGTPTYNSWYSMKSRCKYPENHSYLWYGARGIGYDNRWEKFECFLEDMGERPEGCTLDRIDVEKDYCKENCRWADRELQQNNKRNNRFIEENGIRHTVAEWSRIKNVDEDLIRDRLRRGFKGDIFSKKRSALELEFRGQKRSIREWAEMLGINPQTIRERLRRGWSVDDALSRKVEEE